MFLTFITNLNFTQAKGRFLRSKLQKTLHLEYFMKYSYSWSILSQKSLLIFVSSILQVFSTFLFETDGHCHQMSFLLSENREVYGGFCQDYAATQFDAEREKRVKKCWSDSVEITQDVSEWYRECQSCRKKSPLQLLRPAEHDLCGRLQFIHTKSTARKLLLESDSSGL